MIIKIAYLQNIRKDGKYNMVVADTEKKTYSNWDSSYIKNAVFIEAKLSSDIDMLRRKLKEEGYADVTPSAS